MRFWRSNARTADNESMGIPIYNLRADTVPGTVIRCDRGTDWGNPFVMKSERDRDYVCEMFERYAKWRITVEPTWLEPLRHATGLACWCVPKRCHVETIVRMIEEGSYQWWQK